MSDLYMVVNGKVCRGAVHLRERPATGRNNPLVDKNDANLAFPHYYRGVGARVIQKRGLSQTQQKKESRTIAMIMGAVGLPVLLACMLVAEDMRTDLSDLKPVAGAQALVGWPDLDPRDGHPAQTRWPPQTLVKMLGYMMDGYSPSADGAEVRMFLLMPEAGHLLHPAHRIPEEMVEVWLNRPAWFKYRRLVWVSGVLERTTNVAKSDKALFAMHEALITPASDPEIARWFVPWMAQTY